jgi:hypothetical protein
VAAKKPARRAMKLGFIDEKGAWAIEPRFEQAKQLSGGLAPVCEGGKWGYVDRAGVIAIPFGFSAAEPFDAFGVAAVRRGSDDGAIDRTGAPLPVPQYTGAPKHFSEGLAPSERDGLVGYIDEARRWVVPPRFARGFHFSEGKAWVQEQGDAGKDGASAIDRDGNVLFHVSGFHQCFEFSGGMARVQRPGRSGWVDQEGRLAIDLGDAPGAPPYPGNHPGGDFSEGLAFCWAGGKATCIDATGAKVFETVYTGIETFKNGYARIRTNSAPPRWGLVDRAGQIALMPAYKSCGDVVDGVGIVQIAALDFGIFAVGRPTLVVTGFDEIRAFDERGIAVARLGGKVRFIDRAGVAVATTDVDQVKAWVGDRAAAQRGGKWGVVDRDGKIVVEPRYDLIGTLGPLTVVNLGGALDRQGVFVGGRWGFIDASGAERIPLGFDVAGRFSEGLAVAGVLR